MDNINIEEIVAKTSRHLKDFQSKTVELIYKKLYIDGENKHLVADEVGLGKTIVAKGLIARALQDHLKNGGNKFRVIYICSNQALAAQNLRKLNLFKDSTQSNIEVGRLIFQAFEENDKSIFKLTSLTPSTSFRLIRGPGIQEERLLIYTILSDYKVFTKGRRNNGLKLTLIGHVEDPLNWKTRCDIFKNSNHKRIRKSIFRKFKDKIRNQSVDSNKFKNVYEELGFTKPQNLQDILIRYSELLNIRNVKIGKNGKKYIGHLQLLSLLRSLLTEICLEYLDANLYILDEFQRFTDLIDTQKEDVRDLSEAAAIAKKIFEKKGAKVLMLSATPFKPFSTRTDDENEEGHYKEFTKVLKFLIKDKSQMNGFIENRKAFFELLRRPENLCLNEDSKLEIQLIPKYELEKLYRKVISRTERLIVSDDKNTLVKYKQNNGQGKSLLNIQSQDIDDFKNADSLIMTLKEHTNISVNSIMSFVLSSPYPFSYLDNYNVKKVLKNIKSNKQVEEAILNSKKGWIDWDKIQHYKPIGIVPNAKMRLLLNETIDNGMWKQLWLAPSLPYYNLEGVFKGSELNSKTLLFSKWVMVPKMIASLLSYEAERLTIGDKRILRKDEESRIYTPPMGNTKRIPRSPTKILAIQMKDEKAGKMSAFTLLYPSITLANLFHPVDNIKIKEPLSLKDLRITLKYKIEKLIQDTDLKKYCNSNKTTRNWYWAAAILLDKELSNERTKNAIDYVSSNTSYFINSKMKENEDEEHFDIGANGKHFEELKSFFNNPESLKLGQMPIDLVDVLVDMTIGSPAICFFRTISHYFPNDDINLTFVKGLDIASGFHSLFDKPESISIIQLSAIINKKRKAINNSVYWKDVLKYCVDGNLQSVLDEYGHMIYADNKNIILFSERFYNTININTTSIKVDSADSFLNEEKKVMRCHFAVDFGNQDMDKEEGRNRMANVLDNFNSPFRPFVLASTSIGQEGLDFHYYCRKIVHWNLPSNPIDFEQREGRINRFKGLVIRQNIVKKYKYTLEINDSDIWEHLFRKAREIEGNGENPKPELVPYWHVEGDGIHIERIVPILPYSKEVIQLKRLLETLTLYRLTFGQPRQEELLESLFNGIKPEDIDEIREKLMINLSPISYLK